MYPKIKKYKQQDLFDNSLIMPVGKKCHAIGLQRLVQWSFVYGVSECSIKGCGRRFRLYVKYGNGCKFHSRWIVSRHRVMDFAGYEEPPVLVYAYRIMLALYWMNYGEKIPCWLIPSLVQKLCRSLKKSRIH